MLKALGILWLLSAPGIALHYDFSETWRLSIPQIVPLMDCPLLSSTEKERLLNLPRIDIIEIDLDSMPAFRGGTICGTTWPQSAPHTIYLTTNPIVGRMCWPDGNRTRTIRHELLHLAGLRHETEEEIIRFDNIITECGHETS